MSRIKNLLKYLGPAFIVCVAYIDPGNFATNITAGSKFNYNLLWVILWSNLMAIFLQSMSAKLGIATGLNLPQMCNKVFSKKTNWVFWIFAQFASIATELAEFLGGTLGLYLLFNIPMPFAAIITAILTFLIIYMSKYGQRTIEIIIISLVSIISVSYALEIFLSKPLFKEVGLHTLIPNFPNGEAILIAVAMLGATVMPHVIYLHSQLVQCRNISNSDVDKKLHYKMAKIDISIAMNIAFIVNSAMVIVSASVFYRNGITVETIEQAHKSLSPLLGSLSSGVFGIALLASGLSSAAVGAMAGQTMMQGFVGIKFSDNLSRIVTMSPGIIIIMLGINPMKSLIISQVVLSFVLPLAVIPLILITSKKEFMGTFVNTPITKFFGWLITAIIISLNALLVGFIFF